MKGVVRLLSTLLVLFLLIRVGPRFLGNFFALFARYWFIVIPVLLVVWFYLRQRNKYQEKKRRNSNLDPDMEIRVDQEKDK